MPAPASPFITSSSIPLPPRGSHGVSHSAHGGAHRQIDGGVGDGDGRADGDPPGGRGRPADRRRGLLEEPGSEGRRRAPRRQEVPHLLALAQSGLGEHPPQVGVELPPALLDGVRRLRGPEGPPVREAQSVRAPRQLLQGSMQGLEVPVSPGDGPFPAAVGDADQEEDDVLRARSVDVGGDDLGARPAEEAEVGVPGGARRVLLLVVLSAAGSQQRAGGVYPFNSWELLQGERRGEVLVVLSRVRNARRSGDARAAAATGGRRVERPPRGSDGSRVVGVRPGEKRVAVRVRGGVDIGG